MYEKHQQVEARWIIRLLNGFAVIVLTMIAVISLQVSCSLLEFNPIVEFDRRWPIVGQAITLNSLLDIQWHLLCLIGLLPASIVWLKDGHVRVDFIYARLSARGKGLVDLVGALAFAVPFFVMSIPAAWQFMAGAYRLGQGSSNGGLNDLFVIKATLPVGLGLLLVVVIWDIAKSIEILKSR